MPRVTGLCAGYSPLTGEFPAQTASNTENVSIWWGHLEMPLSAARARDTYRDADLVEQISTWKKELQIGA